MQLLSALRQSNTCDKIILEQSGALGDFLLTWTSIAAIRQFFPKASLLWHGAFERLFFLTPLDITPVPASMQKTLINLHSSDHQIITHALNELERSLVFRFHLDKKPTALKTERVLSILGFISGQLESPRHVYESQLKALGLDVPENGLEYFHTLFSTPPAPDTRTILLFPGSGHPAKNWPHVQFFSLASRLQKEGFHPLFVLGPIEQELGLKMAPWPTVVCDRIEDLVAQCNNALAAIGGDTGPMHLAGFLQKPVVSLFGPTNKSIFAPPGAHMVSAATPCSPCTQLCKNLSCQQPICMEKISVDAVMDALYSALPHHRQQKRKTGFSGLDS